MRCNDNKETLNKYKIHVKELVRAMTTEEKIFQMLHEAPAIERLQIKAYNWWSEGLHGVARAGTATVFPQAIGLAASFDPDLLQQIGDAIATEARAKFNMQQKYQDAQIYKGLTLWAPNINIFRDPRWGRGHETYGEDPYLTSRLGVAFVQGMQGDNPEYLKTAACAKHFAVHSGPEKLRHSFDAVVSKKDLNETYLPAFRALVQEGKVEAVMGAYNRLNGEACCGSEWLLTELLRNQWKFEGHVVSDCHALRDIHENHHITSDAVESAALAVNSGCDLNCGKVFLYLLQAVKEGKVPIESIDRAVTNLFMTRMKLGILDQTADRCEKENGMDDKTKSCNPYDKIPYQVVDSKAMQMFNQQVAEKTIVLLKNQDKLLPLDKKKLHTIGVIGPNANNRKALVGNYEGTASRYVTILEGIQDYVKEDGIRVLYSEGCDLFKLKYNDGLPVYNRLSEVLEICEESDVIIACFGIDASLEGEQGDKGNEFASGDKESLSLPGAQQRILDAIADSNKPAVLVLLSGSALAIGDSSQKPNAIGDSSQKPNAIGDSSQKPNAILQGWYPGAQGGHAIARVLFGDVVPEGRLPITFYRTTEELPDFTDYSMEGRTYRFMKQEALYPFGYGLSYTEFSYRDLSVVSEKQKEHGADVTVFVKNAGNYSARETVQIYVKAVTQNSPNAQLKAIQKVALEAGEEKKIELHLPESAFWLYDEDGHEYIPDCEFNIYAGGSQPDARSVKLMNQKPLMVTVR